MTNSYSFYGLHLATHWRLPYAESAREQGALAAIELRAATPSDFAAAAREAPALASNENWHQYNRLRDGTDYLRWPDLFEFLISRDGRLILGRPLGLAPADESFHTYLLGQVLSCAMLKLGIEPLHATAVVLGGKAVAFMGDCGRGKSSLAASLLRDGCRLLTDDLLTLQETDRGVVAHPGPPRIKLFPEMAAALLGRDVAGLPMNPLTSKIVIPLEPRQSYGTAAPLEAIYVLAPAAANVRRVTIRRLTQRQALIELLRNTFNRHVTDPTRLEQQFRHAAWVSARIPVKLLSYPRDLKTLPAVHDAIATDIARGSAASVPFLGRKGTRELLAV